MLFTSDADSTRLPNEQSPHYFRSVYINRVPYAFCATLPNVQVALLRQAPAN